MKKKEKEEIRRENSKQISILDDAVLSQSAILAKPV